MSRLPPPAGTRVRGVARPARIPADHETAVTTQSGTRTLGRCAIAYRRSPTERCRAIAGDLGKSTFPGPPTFTKIWRPAMLHPRKVDLGNSTRSRQRSRPPADAKIYRPARTGDHSGMVTGGMVAGTRGRAIVAIPRYDRFVRYGVDGPVVWKAQRASAVGHVRGGGTGVGETGVISRR